MMASDSSLGLCQILSQFSADGMGEVCRAWETRLNREIAINDDNPRR